MDPVKLQCDPAYLARAFARTPEQRINFMGFLLYSMRAARGFERIYREEMGAAPPGLGQRALEDASRFVATRMVEANVINMRGNVDFHRDVTDLIARLGTRASAADSARMQAELATNATDIARLQAENTALKDAVSRGVDRQVEERNRRIANLEGDLRTEKAEFRRVHADWVRESEALAQARADVERLQRAARGGLTPAQQDTLNEIRRILVSGGGGGGGGGVVVAEGGSDVADLRADVTRLEEECAAVTLREQTAATQLAQARSECQRLGREKAALERDLETAQQEIQRIKGPNAFMDVNRAVDRVKQIIMMKDSGPTNGAWTNLRARWDQILAFSADDPLRGIQSELKGVVGVLGFFHMINAAYGACAKFDVATSRFMLQPMDSLPNGLKTLMTNICVSILGTDREAERNDVITSQEASFGALRCNTFSLALEGQRWVMRDTPAPVRNTPVRLLDSYASYVASAVPLLWSYLGESRGLLDLAFVLLSTLEANQESVDKFKLNIQNLRGRSDSLGGEADGVLGLRRDSRRYFNRVLASTDDLKSDAEDGLGSIVRSLSVLEFAGAMKLVMPDAINGLHGGVSEVRDQLRKALRNWNSPDDAVEPCSKSALAAVGVTSERFLGIVGATLP